MGQKLPSGNFFICNKMLKSCCELGSEIHKDRVIHKTDNFFVISTLGSIGIEGYLLIISKEHYEGVGDVPEELYPELNDLASNVQRVLQEQYGKLPFIFEHGPRVCGIRGGGCLDHAHLHIVPGVDVTSKWAGDMMKRLESAKQFYRVDRIEGFDRVGDIYRGGKSSYVFVESPQGVRYVSEVNFQIPSQYFRRMIAEQVGSGRWNWRLHPDEETAKRTVEKLRGKFN